MTRLKLLSGGPTGVDRAALAVGLVLGLAVGGGCPQGRRAEDGRIPARYPLVETPKRNDQARTRRHIEDADGTLILNLGKLDGGTALTARHARQRSASRAGWWRWKRGFSRRRSGIGWRLTPSPCRTSPARASANGRGCVRW